MSTYSETIRALKDYDKAKKRLADAEVHWFKFIRYLEYPITPFNYGFAIPSTYIGEIAQEFLSAHNAYERLGAISWWGPR